MSQRGLGFAVGPFELMTGSLKLQGCTMTLGWVLGLDVKHRNALVVTG